MIGARHGMQAWDAAAPSRSGSVAGSAGWSCRATCMIVDLSHPLLFRRHSKPEWWSRRSWSRR